MLTFKPKRIPVLTIAMAWLCTSTTPGLLLADDEKDKSTPPSRTVLTKPDAPAPGLTERERMFLDRVEQLEKRIAELEAKVAPSAATATPPAVEGAGSQPNSANTDNATALAVSSADTAGPAAPRSSTNVISPEKAIASFTAQAMQEGNSGTAKKPASVPFAFADFTWLNGNARTKESPMDTKFFTPEIRADVDYVYDFNHPKDDTIGGSSEVFRSSEVQLTQLGVGGDFHYDNVQRPSDDPIWLVFAKRRRATTPVPSRGQWNLADAYRYLSEAYGGYHFNAMHGINVQAGIFMSYVGLFSYYNFDNWAYQPSYVSSNTPWFFNGVRVQIFPTEHLKIEPWFMNGWQSYGRFNNRPGFGMQILWRPNGMVIGSWESIRFRRRCAKYSRPCPLPHRRQHTDQVLRQAGRMAGQDGFFAYRRSGLRAWRRRKLLYQLEAGTEAELHRLHVLQPHVVRNDKFGLTLGGGKINNPGRYLVLLPPINGATATSGTPYFTENPGDPFKAWDASGTFDYMPSQYITFRWEFDHRAANVPYFSGPGGITPPGGNTGAPGSLDLS